MGGDGGRGGRERVREEMEGGVGGKEGGRKRGRGGRERGRVKMERGRGKCKRGTGSGIELSRVGMVSFG